MTSSRWRRGGHKVAGEDQFFRFVGPPLVRTTLPPHPLGTLELAGGSDRSTFTASSGYSGRSTWRALTACFMTMATSCHSPQGFQAWAWRAHPHDSFLAYKTGPKLLPGSCPTPLLGQGVPRRRRYNVYWEKMASMRWLASILLHRQIIVKSRPIWLVCPELDPEGSSFILTWAVWLKCPRAVHAALAAAARTAPESRMDDRVQTVSQIVSEYARTKRQFQEQVNHVLPHLPLKQQMKNHRPH